MDSRQILLDIPNKLIAAPGQLAKDTVYSRFGLIPIIFGDIITVYGAHFYIHVGKGHLVEHETPPGVKRLADDHRCFDCNAASVNDLPREERIIAGMTGLIFPDNCRSRYAIFQEYIRKKFTIGSIIAIVYVRL